jgi:ABC-type sugar transport system permease subunit
VRGARLPSTLTASTASTRKRSSTELYCCPQQLLTYNFVIFPLFWFTKYSLNYTTLYRMYMYVVRCNRFVRFLSDVNILSNILITIHHHLIIISYVENASM